MLPSQDARLLSGRPQCSGKRVSTILAHLPCVPPMRQTYSAPCSSPKFVCTDRKTREGFLQNGSPPCRHDRWPSAASPRQFASFSPSRELRVPLSASPVVADTTCLRTPCRPSCSDSKHP